jgi:hypothetical protein
MAADGLEFEISWWSDADDEWAVGKGFVLKGVVSGAFIPCWADDDVDKIKEHLLKEKTDDDLPF